MKIETILFQKLHYKTETHPFRSQRSEVIDSPLLRDEKQKFVLLRKWQVQLQDRRMVDRDGGLINNYY